MRPARSLLLYIVVVFVGGALLAPWLYWLAQFLGSHSGFAGPLFTKFLEHLADAPFRRFVERSFLGMALIFGWPLLRSLGATSLRDIGLTNPLKQLKPLGCGLLLGFGSLAIVAAIVLAVHARQLNSGLTASDIEKKLGVAALTAIVVALLEEILFRGIVFGALRKTWNVAAAILVSSMIYAIVHFLHKADLPPPVTWTSGLRLLPLMAAGFTDFQIVIPGFLTLTLAGILLALAYQRTGNLYFSIGLHAGWIFWLKSYGVFTSPVADANLWLWGTDRLIDGWLAFVVLTFALLLLLRLLRDKQTSRFFSLAPIGGEGRGEGAAKPRDRAGKK